MREINFNHVTFKYPNSRTLMIDDQSFNLPTNKWIGIIGHNGSGKSTIMRLLDGLLLPNKGQITIGNLAVNEQNLEEVHKLIGMVFQNPENQFVGSTVAEDVAFGLENYNIAPERMPMKIKHALATVGMTKYENSLISDLSGGQKQRIAIAGVLAVRTPIIVLDEATSMLDPMGRESIMKLLRKLHDDGHYTIIMITHDLNEAELADHILVLDQGKVLANDVTERVLSNRKLLKELQLIPAAGEQIREKLIGAGIRVPDKYLRTEEMVRWLKQKLN
ncbi:energy-coupling factor transporter ATPase [Limosilactobacillus fastidiosus]|uniref:Energy-coupling factor transporter ATPase n=1 Tax=Limosilactobacillus fastidiosus TaxID=2759855 RepID=A0A7W3YCE2_9LACO|nr:energy-coupling factor transporter ATPase [Limosilactobacillus fastidiosus]MBB1086011.1 energy-coupling factor transporter ATPase [Limosilactobacillus fastidiosus]MCD7085652.1 energy-coupling factor transporter ATPase [Limosilactobacillus fastidiosus]MCD7114140.1 energy-coupling factor transporter ATPase [Limosilactobacillus fastidiosus]MCD7116726.1 energy-coupling factor transporter ATPase [Limosilactobacillus fastidiosus]